MATLAADVRQTRAPVAPQQQGLGLTYHRLMLVMLLFVGVTLVIVGRLAMLQIFTDRRRTFIPIARPATPELVQAVNSLGEPGLVFNREPERLYPQTALAGH